MHVSSPSPAPGKTLRFGIEREFLALSHLDLAPSPEYCVSRLHPPSAEFGPFAGGRSCRVVNRVRQRGSNCGSITGPISVASGCFPLSNVLIDLAKLFRLRRF